MQDLQSTQFSFGNIWLYRYTKDSFYSNIHHFFLVSFSFSTSSTRSAANRNVFCFPFLFFYFSPHLCLFNHYIHIIQYNIYIGHFNCFSPMQCSVLSQLIKDVYSLSGPYQLCYRNRGNAVTYLNLAHLGNDYKWLLPKPVSRVILYLASPCYYRNSSNKRYQIVNIVNKRTRWLRTSCIILSFLLRYRSYTLQCHRTQPQFRYYGFCFQPSLFM